ncbi:MAG: hypothetical protein PUD22_08800, partial [Erysipelotrichaceae bacterium]|nr:hypothetical protein [Erysipelotrichaceae bacterium]
MIDLEINLTRGLLLSSLTKGSRQYIYLDKDNYQSNERPKCGCPVLFPFSGTNKDNLLIIDGKKYETGIHGLVHSNNWELFNISDSFAEFITSDSEFSRKSFPFAYQMRAKISLDGNRINYLVSFINNSENTMPCDCGFHPFFNISNLDNLSIAIKNNNSIIDMASIKANGQLFQDIKEVKVIDADRSIAIELVQGLKNVLLWSGRPDKFLVIEPLSSRPNAINENTNSFNLKQGEAAFV